jgi:hypothetical protein
MFDPEKPEQVETFNEPLVEQAPPDHDPPSTQPPSGMPPRLTRAALLDAGACDVGLRFFETRVDDGGDGHAWTPDEARRSYERSPAFLRFLESRELVPMLDVKGLPAVEERQADIEARRARHANPAALPALAHLALEGS